MKTATHIYYLLGNPIRVWIDHEIVAPDNVTPGHVLIRTENAEWIGGMGSWAWVSPDSLKPLKGTVPTVAGAFVLTKERINKLNRARTIPTVGDLLGIDDTAPKPCDFSHRRSMLDEALTLVTGDRNNTYGDPRDDFRKTAAIWTAQLQGKLKEGEKIETWEVAAMMIGLKLSRINSTPEKRDSWVDAAGYAACGFECIAMEGEGK